MAFSSLQCWERGCNGLAVDWKGFKLGRKGGRVAGGGKVRMASSSLFPKPQFSELFPNTHA